MLEVNIIQKNGKKVIMASSYTFLAKTFYCYECKTSFSCAFLSKKKKMKRNYSCICGVRPEKVFGPKNAFLGTPALFDTTYILSGRPILMIQGVPFWNFFMMKMKWKVEENSIEIICWVFRTMRKNSSKNL